ncbi:gas vesicle protein [Streptomyces hoynatensis]|uniref:Gas vesicle protein n=1 Tax=Streptomyces hoynatensis TaxID=1141874 RepID=A0A3A9YYU3_9ACTN|nr:GvpL/GvpF family gas vesicle protein [Streptomyces hoynatensis]RKN40909.1 gas vesicle protein [Streptomyces hoynatensis]
MHSRHLYVYGIVRAGHPLPPGRRGVGAPPGRLRAVRRGSLAAVVSPSPERLLARRRDLLAHQDTLLALADHGPVLPMRFGMVAPDEQAVTRRLAEDADGHLAALERLTGRVEFNLKAFPVEDSLADLVREDPTVRRLRERARRRPGYEASLRLGEAIATGLGRRAAEAVAETLRRLTPLAESTAPGPEVKGCVRNVSFLVPVAAQERFAASTARCAGEFRHLADLRLTGPLPCFSFVPSHRDSAADPAGRS